MKRVFKSIGRAKFKGSGFYETDYKNKEKCVETEGRPG
jgi:predicted nucleic acid-binding Zn ribbon protein